MTKDEVRALFLARRDAIAAPVAFNVPGFGRLFVKTIDVATAQAHADVLGKPENAARQQVVIAAMSVCDEAGGLVFDASSEDDLALIAGIDPASLRAVVTNATYHNAQSPEGVAEAGNA